MPQREKPIKARSKAEDESTGTPNPSEQHGKHREEDEALPGKNSEKGGLNKQSPEQEQ